MTSPEITPAERSYGCTFGCGNPYDFVVIDIKSGTTEFLCLPCFVRLAGDMVAAVTESSTVIPWMGEALSELARAGQAPGPAGRKRGKNAPATEDDPGIIGAFESVITAEELPEEFR